MKLKTVLSCTAPALMLAACFGDIGADENFRLADEAFADNRFADARAAYTAGLASAPDAMDMRLKLARSKLRLGDSDGALATLEALPADIQQGEEVRLLRAEAHMLGGRYKASIAELGRLTNSRSDYVRALSEMGRGDMAAAQIAFLRGADGKDADPRLLAEYGLFELRRGNIPLSSQLIARAKKLAPSELSVLLAEGELAINQDRADRAVAAYGKAVEMYPDSIVSKLAYADALGAAGRTDDAEQIVQAVVGEGRAQGDAALILAKIAAQRSDWRRVRELMQPLSGRGLPDDRVLYARSLVELGFNNLAIAEIEPLAATLPADHPAFEVLVAAYQAEGDSVNAARYMKAIQKDRTSPGSAATIEGNAL